MRSVPQSDTVPLGLFIEEIEGLLGKINALERQVHRLHPDHFKNTRTNQAKKPKLKPAEL